MTQMSHCKQELPFVVSTFNGEINYWMTKPVGNFEADFATGKAYGLSLIEYARRENDPIILQCVVKQMPRDLGDLERGFLQVIMGAAIS